MGTRGYKRSQGDGEYIDMASNKETLQRFERAWRDKLGTPDWRVPLQVMNLMEKMANEGSDVVRVFNWLKGVEKVTQHRVSGRICFHCGGDTAFYAERLFDFLGADLLRTFKTRNMEARHNGRAHGCMSGDTDRKGKMDPHLFQNINRALHALGGVEVTHV